MKRITRDELKRIVELHEKWVNEGRSGVRADLRNYDLINYDLRGSNLMGAYLTGADLAGTMINNCIGNMKEIRSIQLETYAIAFTKEVLAIGCEQHSIDDWKNFSDDDICEMDGALALAFWEKWKDHIFATIDLCFREE